MYGYGLDKKITEIVRVIRGCGFFRYLLKTRVNLTYYNYVVKILTYQEMMACIFHALK